MWPNSEAAAGREANPPDTGNPPLIAVSMGDARGIGPEVLLKALAHQNLDGMPPPLIFGVRRILETEAEQLWSDRSSLPEPVSKALKKLVDILDPEESKLLPRGEAGQLSRYLLENPVLSGKLAGRAIERSVACISSGGAVALLTAPIDKNALNAAGYNYPGHTEMLAHLAGDLEVSMMLAAGGLRVVPATTHIALSAVREAISEKLLAGQCRIIHRGLRGLFGIVNPRIAVCGLNPHLGDGGLAGDEDLRVVAPAVSAARNGGIDVSGPFSADTVFVRAARGEFDAVLAMYHDQAMIAIKMHAFGKGVNITLGLPYVRTSPDHGVALDIAGKGTADESSMVEALKLAWELSGKQLKRRGG
jgi:4-phospho-D-threonate 3-dehydrogenase / 4-phospho-D-erythronate 3-dehydrogenase